VFFELSLLGTASVTFLGLKYREYRDVVPDVALFIVNDRLEDADKRLHQFLRLPTPTWDIARQALCLNLKAFIISKHGTPDEVFTICEEILALDNLATSIRGLTYLRMADVVDEREAQSYRDQALEQWYAGLEDLGRLNEWDSLAFFFYGTDEFERAAECFERSLQKRWTLTALTYLAFCYHHQEERLALAATTLKEALRHGQIPLMKIVLYYSLQDSYFRLGEYQDSYEACQDCLKIYKRYPKHRRAEPRRYWNLQFYSVYNLRFLGRYEDADAAKASCYESLTHDDVEGAAGFMVAESDFEQCLEFLQNNPEDRTPAVRDALGAAWHGLGDPVAALEHLHNSDGAEERYFKARAHWELLQLIEVEEQLNSLVSTYPDFVLRMRYSIALVWHGDLDAARRLGDHQVGVRPIAFYTGDIAFIEEQLEKSEYEHYGCGPQRIAEGHHLFRRGTLLCRVDRLEEARDCFVAAEPLFSGSPFEMAFCRVLSLRCRVRLGENEARDESVKAWEHYARKFRNHKCFQLELECLNFEMLLASGAHEQVITQITAYLEKEPRRFTKARQLQKRAQSYLATDRRDLAAKDLRDIISYAPGSYLAKWAQKRI
jgi:tetratricopeptide (TPR) repeat protein